MNHQYRLKLQQEIINDISRLQEKISDLFELQELEIEAYRNLLDTIILQSATDKGFRKSRKSHRSRKGKSSECCTVVQSCGDFEKQIISRGQKIVVQEFKNLIRPEAQSQEKIRSIVSKPDQLSYSRKINEVSNIEEAEIERRNKLYVMEDMGLFDFVGEEEYSEDPVDNPDDCSDDYAVEEYPNEYLGESIEIANFDEEDTEDFDKEDTEDFDGEEIERRNLLDIKYEMESLDDYFDYE